MYYLFPFQVNLLILWQNMLSRSTRYDLFSCHVNCRVNFANIWHRARTSRRPAGWRQVSSKRSRVVAWTLRMIQIAGMCCLVGRLLRNKYECIICYVFFVAHSRDFMWNFIESKRIINAEHNSIENNIAFSSNRGSLRWHVLIW